MCHSQLSALAGFALHSNDPTYRDGQQVIDNMLKMIDECHTKVNKFERWILLQPRVELACSSFPNFASVLGLTVTTSPHSFW